MRKILFAAAALILTGTAFAQSDSTVKTQLLGSRALPKSNDHLMIQVGYTGWDGKPDSINTTGFSRSLNVYFMLNLPFRTNPRFSAAIGAGIGSDHIFFNRTRVGIADNTTNLRIVNIRSATAFDTTAFKRNKLATSYVEAPVELRFLANPNNPAKSIKAAIGLKAGLLLNAHTKGKELRTKSDRTLNDYKEKQFSKRFFNTNRLVGTARIGIGHFSLFGTYQVTTLFKEGVGPAVRPFTIGLNISGL